MSGKQEKRFKIEYGFSPYDLDGPIDEVIGTLRRRQNYWQEEGYKDLEINIDSWFDQEGYRIGFSGTRLETDEEYGKRITVEELRKNHREEQDLKDLERLKKKYPAQFK
jgi:hypothetical protein